MDELNLLIIVIIMIAVLPLHIVTYHIGKIKGAREAMNKKL